MMCAAWSPQPIVRHEDRQQTTTTITTTTLHIAHLFHWSSHIEEVNDIKTNATKNEENEQNRRGDHVQKLIETQHQQQYNNVHRDVSSTGDTLLINQKKKIM